MERSHASDPDKAVLAERRRLPLAMRFAAAALAIGFLSGCAVQICDSEFPYRTDSCPIDSLAPAAAQGDPTAPLPIDMAQSE